jgi:hypothetical protein
METTHHTRQRLDSIVFLDEWPPFKWTAVAVLQCPHPLELSRLGNGIAITIDITIDIGIEE